MINYFLNRQRLPSAKLSSRQIECHTCGAIVAIPELGAGQMAVCPRCETRLVRIESEPYWSVILYAIASLVVLIPVTGIFFLGMSLPGASEHLTLPKMMATLWNQHFGFLGNIMFIFVFATPLFFLLLCIYVYLSLIFRKYRPSLRVVSKILLMVRPWLMVDIFFVSALVSLVKIRAVAQVEFGWAFLALFLYSILLVRTMLLVPSYWLHEQISALAYEIYPQRYKGYTHEKPRKSMQMAWAFLLSAMILYIPANLMPIMISSNPLSTITSQIFDGVVYMWMNGDQVIAVIIFIASIAVPLFKIVAMLILLISAKFRLLLPPLLLTRLYYFIERIGRWSMIDIFVIIILMAIFHTPIARVTPGPAVVYFTLVVFLTMLSTHFFDTRLVWDKYLERNSNESRNSSR